MTMRKLVTTTLMGLVLTLGACDKGDAKKGDQQAKTDKKTDDGQADGGGQADGSEEAVDAPSLDPKVEQAVTVANQISANPGDADAILEEAGLDRDSYETLLYEIARDPALSKSYAVARETA